MAAMTSAYIALGANLGDAVATLTRALRMIGKLPATQFVRTSSFYRTAPVETTGPDYVNAVTHVKTQLSAEALFEVLMQFEAFLGRVRPVGVLNAPRTIDLDFLLYGDLVQDEPRLSLPHPRMHLRAFVLVPLLEIEHEVAIPGRGRAVDCLADVLDQEIECLQESDALFSS